VKAEEEARVKAEEEARVKAEEEANSPSKVKVAAVFSTPEKASSSSNSLIPVDVRDDQLSLFMKPVTMNNTPSKTSSAASSSHLSKFMQPVQPTTPSGHGSFGASRSIVGYDSSKPAHASSSSESLAKTPEAQLKASELASMFEEKAKANKDSPNKPAPLARRGSTAEKALKWEQAQKDNEKTKAETENKDTPRKKGNLAEKWQQGIRESEEAARIKNLEDREKAEIEKSRIRKIEEARLRAEFDAMEAKKLNPELSQDKAEQEAKEKAEQEEKLKAEQEAKEKAEQEEKLKAEQEAKEKAEREEELKAEQDASTPPPISKIHQGSSFFEHNDRSESESCEHDQHEEKGDESVDFVVIISDRVVEDFDMAAQDTFTNTTANCLGVPASQVVIQRVEAGSVVVISQVFGLSESGAVRVDGMISDNSDILGGQLSATGLGTCSVKTMEMFNFEKQSAAQENFSAEQALQAKLIEEEELEAEAELQAKLIEDDELEADNSDNSETEMIVEDVDGDDETNAIEQSLFNVGDIVEVACDVEDGDMLFWLPAVVSKHATTEEGDLMGYAVRMLDSEDTFAGSQSGEEDTESTIVSCEDVRSVQAPPPSSSYGFEYGSGFSDVTEVSIGTLCTAWFPAINQHVRAVITDISMLENGPRPKHGDEKETEAEMLFRTLSTPKGSVTIVVHREDEEEESLQQVPLPYLRRRGLMEEEDYAGELVMIDEEDEEDEESTDEEDDDNQNDDEGVLIDSGEDLEAVRQEDDDERVNRNLGILDTPEKRSSDLNREVVDREAADGFDRDESLELLETTEIDVDREEEEEYDDDYEEGDDELFSFEGPPAVTLAIDISEQADDVATDAMDHDEVTITHDGSVYIGQEREPGSGEAHGLGIITFEDGNTYAGEWKFGEKEGVGVFAFPNGETYMGEYKKGLMHGKGVYYFENGDRYEGEFAEDVFEGVGRFTWDDGRRYTGGYQNGLVHGRGRLSKLFEDDTDEIEAYRGMFEDGEPVDRPTRPVPDSRRCPTPDSRSESPGIPFSELHAILRGGSTQRSSSNSRDRSRSFDRQRPGERQSSASRRGGGATDNVLTSSLPPHPTAAPPVSFTPESAYPITSATIDHDALEDNSSNASEQTEPSEEEKKGKSVVGFLKKWKKSSKKK